MNGRSKLALAGIVVFTNLSFCIQVYAFRPTSLDDFTTMGRSFGAGVIPYFEDENNNKYVLLGREINSKKKEWAFFSGGSEKSSVNKKKMEHPLQCATREFFEEAMLGKTLNWNENAVEEYIQKNATEVIARYDRDIKGGRPLILYVVKFQKKDIENIVHNFAKYFDDPNIDEKYKEKDALAFVNYQDLIAAVKEGKQSVKIDKKLPYWFHNKKDGEKTDTAFLYDMPYRLLRARYAPEKTFQHGGSYYHYVQDAPAHDLQKNNYTFFAAEQVKLKSKM